MSLYLEETLLEYHRVAEAYKTRGDALTLLSNWRELSDEARREEHANVRAEQLAQSNNYLIPKEEELSVENLYYKIRSNRSSQTLTPTGIFDSTTLLNAVPQELINSLIPLLQSGTSLAQSIGALAMVGSSSGCGLGNENAADPTMGTLVKIEQ